MKHSTAERELKCHVTLKVSEEGLKWKCSVQECHTFLCLILAVDPGRMAGTSET